MKRSAVLLVAALLSSGCTLKYSHNRLDSDWFERRLERGGWIPPVEAALTTNDIALGFSALTVSFEYSTQELEREAVPPVVEFDHVTLESVGVAARFYPLARGPIRPYGGAGFANSSLDGRWTGPNYDVTRYDCFGACTEMYTETFWSGYHPYLLVGVELRPRARSRLSYLFEYRKDTGRGDDFYELGGDRFSAGLRLRWDLN